MGVTATVLLLSWPLLAQAPGFQVVEQAGGSLEVETSSVERHPNGLLESAQLLTDTLVGGVPVKGKPERVGFYASGRLRWGVLSSSTRLDGYRAAAGTRFELFDRDPKDPRRAWLRHATIPARWFCP